MIKFNMEVDTFLSIGDGLVKNAAFKTQSLGSKRMKTIWDMVKYVGVGWRGLNVHMCLGTRPLRNVQFRSSSRKAKILTTGIH